MPTGDPGHAPFASEVTMVRLLLPLLMVSAAGGREPDEHTVWEDEEEAREALVEAVESDEEETPGVDQTRG